jgi:hypothetical protein
MTDATRCPDCGGAGKCPICSGYGTVSEELRSLRLKVNADNARLRQLNAELLAACEDFAKRCVCGGDGEIPVREYDAASGRMEESGMCDPCPRCKAVRAAIAHAKQEAP